RPPRTLEGLAPNGGCPSKRLARLPPVRRARSDGDRDSPWRDSPCEPGRDCPRTGTVPLTAEGRASAPRPVVTLLGQAGSDRVLHEVETARLEVLFAIDYVHRVTPAEEVPAAVVPFVER